MKDVPLTLSVPGHPAVIGVCEVTASVLFKISQGSYGEPWGREREEADLHEMPSPLNGSRDMKRSGDTRLQAKIL